MNGQTLVLHNSAAKDLAHRLIDVAPWRAVMNLREEKRSLAQNDKFWAMLSDVSRAKPDDRILAPDKWKPIFMDACGHKPAFEANLDQDGFVCMGYKSSRLNKSEFSDLIECIYEYGARHGVVWTDPETRQAA